MLPQVRRLRIPAALLSAALLVAVGTGTAGAATAPGLGTAAGYAVLAGSTVTNTDSPTVINGSLGVSPGTAVTNFPPGQVRGGSTDRANAVALQAQIDLGIAYDAAARAPKDVDLSAELGSPTPLAPGVYKASSALQLTGSVTLDGQGNPESVFIFQIPSALTTSSGAVVNLIGAASPCNVYWQVGSSATIGTTTSFVGTVMALQSIAVQNGATIQGRALARVGAVTLDNNVITRPECGDVDGGEDGGGNDGGGEEGGGVPITTPPITTVPPVVVVPGLPPITVPPVVSIPGLPPITIPGIPPAAGTTTTPNSPVIPGTPGTPLTPGTPALPGVPAAPGNPETPLTPDMPGMPLIPGTPMTPGIPFAPGGGQVTIIPLGGVDTGDGSTAHRA